MSHTARIFEIDFISQCLLWNLRHLRHEERCCHGWFWVFLHMLLVWSRLAERKADVFLSNRNERSLLLIYFPTYPRTSTYSKTQKTEVAALRLLSMRIVSVVIDHILGHHWPRPPINEPVWPMKPLMCFKLV